MKGLLFIIILYECVYMYVEFVQHTAGHCITL